MSGTEKKYSEETAQKIDREVKKLIDTAYQTALRIVKENEAQVKLMTDMLIEFETLDAEDIREIMENRWDIDKKRAKLKQADELHKQQAPNEPPAPPKITPLPNKLAIDNE